MKKKLLCFPLLLILALLSACGDEPERLQVIAMDTVMTFQTYGKAAEDVLVSASAEVRRLEDLLSRTDPESAVSRVNSAGGAPVEAGAELSALLETAAEYSRMTGGAFDITLAPVSSAWGFTTDSYRVPSQAELDALLAHAGMEHVHVSGDTVALDSGTQIDLGAIAKGYAADRVLDLYRQAGLERGWAALGGNVAALGCRPDGEPWEIGIQDPAQPDDGNAYAGLLYLEDACAVTSGSYQRYFEQDGRRYHHILDPATGAPADSGLLSVTVVADAEEGSGAMCDALSTALFVMGEEQALDFWRTGGLDFQLVLVTEDGRVVTTAGLEGRFAPAEGSGYTYETVS